MNARDYERIMKEKGLIESPTSVQALANAKVMQENIKRVKNWNEETRNIMQALDVNPSELIQIYQKEKDECIKQAIRQAFVEKEIIAIAGNLYYTQIEHLKRNATSTRSLCLDQLPI